MGSTSSKLDSRNYILTNILHIIYGIEPSTISNPSIYMYSNIICIDADINKQKRTFQHTDGSLGDLLYEVMNNVPITTNTYDELEDCVKKYNEHIRMIDILNRQGL